MFSPYYGICFAITPNIPMNLMTTYKHVLIKGDARNLSMINNESVHLVLTSPPYWNLKEYNHIPKQLGDIESYEEFLEELKKTLNEMYRVIIPGGRMIIVVGDVLLSRRKHKRHRVMPLHADIQVLSRKIGFDVLTPIIWYKISNINYEMKRSNGFLGKPYEPNAIIKNDIEYILLFRKPGPYRSPTDEQRKKSKISKQDYQKWFKQIWADIPGAKVKGHPAPFPIELAKRLIQMFSFVNDTILDPFVGSGTTIIAAALTNRNSIGIEIDETYLELAQKRITTELTKNKSSILHEHELQVIQTINSPLTRIA